ncbi:MAG TPA: hypothetical protein VHU89_13180 [Acidobacteriaceae bacterium]|jgi:hypothetical protein|nr:hypothetical protein [Acidobacteriaceae bacterium]
MTAAAPPVVSPPRPKGWTAQLASLPVLLGCALVCLLFLVASRVNPLADPDIWWHLRNAQELVRGGHFIHHDTWTFTVAGRPWINFEWLAELPFYFADRWLGLQGLYITMMVVASAIVLGIYYLAWLRSRDWNAAFLAAFVGILFAEVSLGPRTLLFGWLFLTIELAILWNLRRGRDWSYALPPLFLVWINTHGSWFLGFGLMLVFFACGLVEGEWGGLVASRWTAAQRRRWLTVIAASAAALFVNPYGWRLVAYPLDAIVHQKLGVRYISEWASLDFHTQRGKIVLGTFVLFGVLQLVKRRKWPLEDLAFALLALYSAMTYARLIFLAGILLAPLLAMDLKGLLMKPYEADGDRPALNVVAMAVLAVIVAFAYPSTQALHAGIAQEFPEAAVPYVRSLAGQGHVFNEYHWGGYFEWQAPAVQEFIDPRADVFVQQGVMADYVRAVSATDTFAILDRYQIRYAVLMRGSPAAYLLDHSRDWKRTYADPLAVGFERVQPGN